MSIGERITTLRKKQNISQIQLAEALGITRQAVSKWENDLSSPDTINLIKLADLLNTDVEYLASGRIPSPLPVLEPVVVKQIQTVEKVVEVEKIVEVEKQVVIEKPIITEKQVVVEKIVDRPIYKKIYRTKYIRSPIEYLSAALVGAIVGFLIGIVI